VGDLCRPGRDVRPRNARRESLCRMGGESTRLSPPKPCVCIGCHTSESLSTISPASLGAVHVHRTSLQVDFVKSDSCFTAVDPAVQPADGPRCYADYQKFAAALNATGRPMVSRGANVPCPHSAVIATLAGPISSGIRT
jgi:hypothetical protein